MATNREWTFVEKNTYGVIRGFVHLDGTIEFEQNDDGVIYFNSWDQFDEFVAAVRGLEGEDNG